MSTLFRGLLASAAGVSKQSKGAQLLERLENSTQLEDRREALTEFNELSAAEPVRLIEKGMAVLVQLLREEDTQLTRDVLETLSNLMDPEMPRDVPAETGEIKAMHNASAFLSSDGHLLEVLNSSEDNDLYVRFHAVQLVMKLLMRARRQTQEHVLNQPATVGRVLSLAEDQREIVRNEVLLLLARLGEGSAGLQNILAFQGAFERLLDIVESEGKEEGGLGSVIVHDCLRIVSTLLARNASSCRFFRESGCLQRVPSLLVLPASHNKGHATSATLACELIGCLLAAGSDTHDETKGNGDQGSANGIEGSPGKKGKLTEELSEDITSTQASLLKLRVLPLLIFLSTDAATATDPALRLQALGTMAELIRGHPSAAAELLEVRVTRRSSGELVSEPFLLRILYTGVRSSSAALRGTTVHLFRCLFHGNSATQLAAAAYLVGPMSAGASAALPGDTASATDPAPEHDHAYMSVALNTLLSIGDAAKERRGDDDASGSSVWVASGVLAAMLHANSDVKRMVSRLPVSPRGSGDSSDSIAPAGSLLMPSIVRQVLSLLGDSSAYEGTPLLLLSLLQLLLTWLTGSAEATMAFSAPMATVPSLLDAFGTNRAAASEFDVHVRGHVAGLLGACLALRDGAAGESGHEASGRSSTVVKLLKQRIGLEAFGDACDALVSSKPFGAARGGATRWSSRKSEALLAGSASVGGVVLYPPEMCALLGSVFEEAHAAILDAHAMSSSGATVDASSVAPKAALPGADSVAVTDSEGVMDPAIASFKALVAAQDAKQRELLDERTQLRDQHACLQAELESARAMAGRADTNRLRADELVEAHAKAESEARAAQEELLVARSELARTTSDLEGLAAAYSQMEKALNEQGQVQSSSSDVPDSVTALDGNSTGSVGAASAASMAVLQAHSDGLARDKAALLAETAELRASLAAAQASGDAAAKAAQAGSEAAELSRAEGAALQARVASLSEALATSEAAEAEARHGREQAERQRDDAEAALEAAAEAAAAQEVDDSQKSDPSSRIAELEGNLAEERAVLEEAFILLGEHDALLEAARADEAALRYELEVVRTPGAERAAELTTNGGELMMLKLQTPSA